MEEKRKPAWLKVEQPTNLDKIHSLMKSKRLHTVCEEAACPNIGKCWNNNHAAFIIMGNICTRNCAYCNVQTGKPLPLDPSEPMNVAEAVKNMGLFHVVITTVTRDDLPDQGAEHFAKTVEAVRKLSPKTSIEVLCQDFLKNNDDAIILIKSKPDVFNHNIETVSRLFNKARRGANYYNSLRLLEMAKRIDPNMYTKSGMMVGLGETDHEIFNTMDDLLQAKVDFLTIGQYLRPSEHHIPIDRYVTPEEFEKYKKVAEEKGFKLVSSSPFTRSSFFAGEDFIKLQNISNK